MSSSPVSAGTALSLLVARTGASGASAATLSLGGEGRPTAEALRDTLRSYHETRLERAGEVARAGQALADSRLEGRKRARAALNEATTKARISDMVKALTRLRGMGGAATTGGQGLTLIASAQSGDMRAFAGVTTGNVEGFYTGAGNDAVTLKASNISSVYTGWTTGPGATAVGGSDDDAVALEAGSVDSVYTGSGHDAVTIRADVVSSIYTGVDGKGRAAFADNDAVAIEAGFVGSVYTGDGADAVAIKADIVKSIYTGSGGDTVSIHAGALGGLYTEEGDDVVTIDTVTGVSTSYRPEADADLDAAGRIAQVATNIEDIHLGAGNDVLNLKVADMISVRGGAGDDLMHLSGGTVALQYSAGDGRDTVMLGAGTTLAIQLDRDATWSSDWDGDALVLTLGSGSIRIYGAAQSAGIGVVSFGQTDPEMLFLPPTLDQKA
ncbi:hypothetical protein LCM17_02365 [Cereibacter sphaeroides]|nr:hypothetical protein [Cereibacter sphaeroides]